MLKSIIHKFPLKPPSIPSQRGSQLGDQLHLYKSESLYHKNYPRQVWFHWVSQFYRRLKREKANDGTDEWQTTNDVKSSHCQRELFPVITKVCQTCGNDQ